MTKPNTYSELIAGVKSGEIKSAKDKDGKVWRFFHSTSTDTLCYFKKRSSRRGYPFYENQFESLVSFGEVKKRTDESVAHAIYNRIAKYRRMALKATFTNSWIETCKNLPTTEKEWKNKGGLDLYKLDITTGNGIDGKVISLKRIAKQYPHIVEQLRAAIKYNSEGHICSRYPFAGYEMTISTRLEGETGCFMAHLDLEYKDMGNGYYYLLINDDNFIGYDVD